MSARFRQDSTPDGLGQNFTSPHVALAVARWVGRNIPTPKTILEPSAGRGAFLTAAREVWPSASQTAIEVDPVLAETLAVRFLHTHVLCADFLELDLKAQSYDLVIGNPPYSIDTGRRGKKGKPIMRSVWEEHVVHARRLAPTVVMILRVNCLGGVERSEAFWPENPISALGVLTPRPSFQDNGKTDATEYAAFVWSDVWTGASIEHINIKP